MNNMKRLNTLFLF